MSLPFPLFFEKGGNSAAEIVGATLISAGGTILMLIAQKQLVGVKKTRNTVGLNEKFLFWQCITCVLLGLTSVFGITASALHDASQNLKWIIIDGFLILMNFYLFYSNFTTYKVKGENMKAAKKSGLTEGERYEKIIAPSLLQISKK